MTNRVVKWIQQNKSRLFRSNRSEDAHNLNGRRASAAKLRIRKTSHSELVGSWNFTVKTVRSRTIDDGVFCDCLLLRVSKSLSILGINI